jgi:competence protein ComEC
MATASTSGRGMAERGRARGRAGTWPEGVKRGREALWAWRLPRFAGGAAAKIRDWFAAEVVPGRLMPWVPVAFGTGVVLYFTADREPSLAAALLLAAGCLVAVLAARRRPLTFPLLIGIAAMAAGFATATLKSVRVAHPILHFPAYNVRITGWVEVREERERTDRIVVRVHHIEGRRLNEPPERVRISVRKGAAPMVGAFIELTARISPPLAPLRPGGYDFARDLYFQGIGATGLAFGAIKPAQPPGPPGAWLRYATVIEGMRDGIDRRIRASLTGDAGSIASALITGKRDAISAPVNDAMYVSSLAHVLSISGYHMAVVAGVVFFTIRALLALSTALATRRPIKKWAALGAIAAATFYLLLSGAEVATQRSYIMTAIVLLGVLADRQALTLRTLSVAALAVMLLAPEAVVHPSFQMSFAATLALIAAYERGLPWATAGADTSLGARVALWGGREVVALILASLVAGLATTPYAAYHFHRVAPYGVIANLLAMPIISAFVMPAGLLGLLAMPLGFDGAMWKLMGFGIDWMIAVALWVASLPGAVGRVPAFGTGPLLAATAGIVLVCLLRTPLRWSGAVLMALGTVWAMATPKPDVLVADGGHVFAVRTADGRLAIMKTGQDGFAMREWLAADADARVPTDPTLRNGFTCDEIGCVARLKDGAMVAVALAAEAFVEDCSRAALVLSQRTAPPWCTATAVDRSVWRRNGSMTLRRTPGGFQMDAARPPTYERPWTRAPTASGSGAPGSSSPAKPPTRDATPRPEDVEPGD